MSAIDITKPVTGNPTTQSVRDNFATAASEITALQAGTIPGLAASSGSSLVGFIQSGTGAVARTEQDIGRSIVRSGDYATASNFNTANLALTEAIGVKDIILPTVNSPNAAFRLTSFDGGPINDTVQLGYNLSDTLYTPNVITEPQIYLGFESNYPNLPSRDPDYGTDATSELYLRYIPIGTIGFTGTQNLIFFNEDRVLNKTIRCDIHGERITLGNTDDSSYHDYLSITPTAWTLTLGDLVATRAIGARPAGFGASPLQWLVTWSGHSGGTSSLRGHLLSQVVSGANAISTADTLQVNATNSATNTVTLLSGIFNQVSVTGSGNSTQAKGLRSTMVLSAAGAVTTADNFIVEPPTLSSTGAITTHNGLRIQNIGHASLVGSAVAIKIDDQTGSVTTARGIMSSISSGAGKYNLFIDGSAINDFASDLTIYSGTAIPAGGTGGKGYKFSSTGNFGVFFGSGAPSLSAAKGSLYLRSDGSGTTDRAYINTNGSTTWTALTTVG